jgi:hypothetical protein
VVASSRDRMVAAAGIFSTSVIVLNELIVKC